MGTNGGKDFCGWSKRDRELAASIGSLVERALGRYGKGLSVSEIARQLSLSAETVRYHSKQNYKKLGVSGKAEAVLAARNLKLL